MPALAALDPHLVHGGRKAGLQLTNGALIQSYYVGVLLYYFINSFLSNCSKHRKKLKTEINRFVHLLLSWGGGRGGGG